ncbi:MAG: group III truncated hemoglobin [Bacteroidota bacterium]
MAIKNDIQDRSDIRKLVTAFYEKLLKEEEFRHLFLEVAEIDVLEHIDVLIDFWESVLFQVGKYKRDLVDIHLGLNQKYHFGLKEKHFKDWLEIFNSTVDDLFTGNKAKDAKDRALSLATIIKMNIDDLERRRLEFNN